MAHFRSATEVLSGTSRWVDDATAAAELERMSQQPPTDPNDRVAPPGSSLSKRLTVNDLDGHAVIWLYRRHQSAATATSFMIIVCIACPMLGVECRTITRSDPRWHGDPALFS